jgi:thymidylate synthase
MIVYQNANDAYVNTLEKINKYGTVFNNTQALFNHGFCILNPLDNLITDTNRKWSKSYADLEWDWYLSKDPNVYNLAKTAKLWLKHCDTNGNVNSNYGAQINRSNQIDYIINKLRLDRNTRQAWLTIYDCKDFNDSPFTCNGFEKDTPCTLNIGFQYYNDELNMTVLMRSNDIKFGFCNDQYCFSKLLEYVAKELDFKIGTYYHYSANMHNYIK